MSMDGTHNCDNTVFVFEDIHLQIYTSGSKVQNQLLVRTKKAALLQDAIQRKKALGELFAHILIIKRYPFKPGFECELIRRTFGKKFSVQESVFASETAFEGICSR